MRMRWGRACRFAAVVIGCVFSGAVSAQIYDSGLSNLMLPVVVSSSTYQSEIYLTPAGGGSVTASVRYMGGADSATPGTTNCGTLVVPDRQIVKKTIGELCPALSAGSNYGTLLIDTMGDTGGPIPALRVYSRVQNSQGIGFSIEAYPQKALNGSEGARIIGIKSGTDSNGITYQTNCFLGRFPGATTATQSVNMLARNKDGTYLGGSKTVSIPSGSLVRVLDVFSAMGLPPAYRDSYSIEFDRYSGYPALEGTFGFCTVQNNNNFSADFRMPAPSQPTYQYGTDLDQYDTISMSYFTVSPGQSVRFIGHVDGTGSFQCFASDPQMLINVRGFEAVIGANWITPRLAFSQGKRSNFAGDASAYNGYLDIEITLKGGVTTPISGTLGCNVAHGIYGLLRMY